MSSFEFNPGESIAEIAKKLGLSEQQVVKNVCKLKLALYIKADESLVCASWNGARFGHWARIDDRKALEVYAFTGSRPIIFMFATNEEGESFTIKPLDGVSPTEGFQLNLDRAYLSDEDLDKLIAESAFSPPKKAFTPRDAQKTRNIRRREGNFHAADRLVASARSKNKFLKADGAPKIGAIVDAMLGNEVKLELKGEKVLSRSILFELLKANASKLKRAVLKK